MPGIKIKNWLLRINAIKIKVERYRHFERRHEDIKQVHQLLSAFHDGEKVYPVKITINEKETPRHQFYMVITVGEINISHKIKEALTNTGAHHLLDGGSLSDGGTSFMVAVPSFVSDFKRDESIIIKNLPDGLLSYKQQQIKRKVIVSDVKKEARTKMRFAKV